MATLRRTEAKAFFANERTFLHWLNMSVTIGSISAALLGRSQLNIAPSTSLADANLSQIIIEAGIVSTGDWVSDASA